MKAYYRDNILERASSAIYIDYSSNNTNNKSSYVMTIILNYVMLCYVMLCHNMTIIILSTNTKL
jgi:hypothetical protein